MQVRASSSDPQAVTPSDEVIDAVLRASRALVAIAARSLANVAANVTLPQYRALVVLCSRGPQSMTDLATALACSPSTATRMCDRLSSKGLIDREHPPGDRREVHVAVTEAGTGLVAAVTRRRRREITQIVTHVLPEDRRAMIDGLHAFATAAGELPEREWATGWSL